MWTEFQIILIYLLLINSHSSSVIALSPITPQSLLDHSPIDPWSAAAVILNFFSESEAENLNPTSKISFPDPVSSSVNEP